MAQKRKCEECEFFELLLPDEGKGICQRYPPTALAGHDSDSQPMTQVDWWCGEFREKAAGG